MSNETNHDFAAIAKKAVDGWKAGARGDAYGIFLAYTAAQQTLFKGQIVNKQRNSIEDEFTFDLATFCDSEHVTWKKADGSRNNARTAKAKETVFAQLFNVTEPTNAIKASMTRAITYGVMLATDYPGEQVTVSRLGALVVPYAAITPRPKADDERGNLLYDRAIENNETEILDGKQGRTLEGMKRLMRPGEKRAPEQKKQEPAVAFSVSVAFVTARLNALLDENAPEDMPALNNDGMKALQQLVAVASRYINEASDEVPFEEEAKPQRRRA